MAIEWVEARLAKTTPWSEGLVTIHLEADVDPFEAGQFAQLAMDLDGKRIKRAYSYASAPNQPPEFFITEVEGGALSPSLVALRNGDPVWITRQAKGFFTLSECADAEVLWLLSTGTGLAPYISMLRTDEPWRRYARIVLVHGVRHANQLAYVDEIRAWQDRHPGQLAFLPYVTREACEGARQCRIPAALENGWLEEAGGAPLRPDTSHVLLCGNPEMIKQMEELLGARGLERNSRRKPGHITTERYW